MLDRSTPPLAGALEKGHEILQPQSITLDNGIPMHLLLSGSQPLIRLEIVFEAGTWYEKKDNTSFFTTKMLSSGTASLTAEQIEQRVAFYGSFLELESGSDRATITLYCLSKHLESSLPLLLDIIKNPVFPEQELLNLKNITLQNLKVNRTKTSYLASTGFKEKLFGKGHPYGRSLQENEIEALSKQHILDFHKDLFNHKNCHIIISGNGDQDFQTLTNKFFGKGLWGNAGKKQQSFENTGTSGRFVVPKEDSLQSSLRLGRPLFTMTHPDYFKTYMLLEILGGYFGSRLMKNIREDKGYTYGIHADLVCHKHAGYMVVGTDVNKENTEDTIQEIFKEIDILKTQPVGADELETVKNYLLGSFFNSINTPFALADKFKTIYFNGLDYSFYSNYISAIENIQPGEILDMANKYLIREKMVECIAGGE